MYRKVICVYHELTKKFLHTVPKSCEMEMKISVNNNHMITYLTLENVIFHIYKMNNITVCIMTLSSSIA